MPIRAFILVETAVGRTVGVSDDLRSLQGVQRVDAVTGPFDVIAEVVVDDLAKVSDLVTSRIHEIVGVVRTITCLALDSPG